MHARRQDEELKLREGAVTWQEVDGETILLDVKSSRYMGVNPSGSLIWAALAAGTNRSKLIEQLQREFGITQAQASADVDAFLADCAGRNLLQ